ncbi:hypothetical protein [Aquipseudomonas alcaligenes]|uniref:hypothetical protein n=1 Tax=Aquipseudomonas alcaligenes TaxID=43263 RepID=UPI0011B6A92F|nr:hypothetical protein [Pseudomonas alcaligenes]
MNEFPTKTNQVLAGPLRVGHSAVVMSYVRLDARCLTTGSSHSLRSFGTAFRGPLTKRYVPKTMRRTYTTTFALGFTAFLAYQSLWWIFHINGWHWHKDLNIPGFFLLLASSPWSLMVHSNTLEIQATFGELGWHFLSAILVATGLGTNFTIAAFLLKKAKELIQSVRT